MIEGDRVCVCVCERKSIRNKRAIKTKLMWMFLENRGKCIWFGEKWKRERVYTVYSVLKLEIKWKRN